jgi:hypothetical protein
MSRINGYGVTGNELQAMVNERILLAKGSIPATNRCLTNSEVFAGAYVYQGSAPSGTFLPTSAIFSPIPTSIDVSNFLANFTNINPIGSQSVLFQMDQIGSPYLNVDLFAQVNGSPLRLDPGSNLDGLFFGGPQYSPQMNQYVKVGNSVDVQANFGLNAQEGANGWGWTVGGYGVLEIWVNEVLTSIQTTGYRPPAYSANAVGLSYNFIVQPNTDYRVNAYAVQNLSDVITDCNGQSTVYLEPSEVYTTDFYVGPGPARFQLRGMSARKFYSPGTYPANGSLSNSWWQGNFTVGETDTVIDASGSSYSSGSYPNLVPSTPYDSVNNWTFIPAGEDSIKLNLYAGSPDTIWEISSYIGCSIPGTVTSLHWSPDTSANACDYNYNYHYFDGVETTIDGFTGYRDYLVTGGFYSGGKISIYPNGTWTISNSAYGINGKQAYTFPNYADSAYTPPGSPGYPYPAGHIFVQPGYYSDGTNWVQVGDSTATTGYNNGVIVDSGACQTSIFYYYNEYDANCNLISSGGIVELLSHPSYIWYNTNSGVSYQLFSETVYTDSPSLILEGYLFNSSFCQGGGGFEEFQ